MPFTEPTTKFQQLLAIYAQQIEDLEKAAFQVFNQMNLDEAFGANLDVFGVLLDEERAGRDDDRYRVVLKTKVLQNKSRGTGNDILEILRVALTDENDFGIVEDSFPAHFDVLINQVVAVIGASIRNTAKGPYALSDGDILDISVDGGPVQQITFLEEDFDDISAARASEVAVVIANGLTGGTSSSSDNYVYIKTATLGESGSIQITGGTANAVLNFSTTIKTGADANQVFMQQIANTVQKSKGAGIRGITFWYVCEDQFGFQDAINGVGFDEGCFTSAG